MHGISREQGEIGPPFIASTKSSMTHVPASSRVMNTRTKSSVQGMFNAISSRYDVLNRCLSLGMDQTWRRHAVRWCECPPGGTVADVCAGSGDLVGTWLRDAQPRRVTGIDFSFSMLQEAGNKIHDARVTWIQGDGERLPLRDSSVQGLTIGFGLRNLIHLPNGLQEMRRVVAPGGSAVILELTRPHDLLWRMAYYPYLNFYVPLVGRAVSGNPMAYQYLRDTIKSFMEPEEIRSQCFRAGFSSVEIRQFMGGIVTLIRSR